MGSLWILTKGWFIFIFNIIPIVILQIIEGSERSIQQTSFIGYLISALVALVGTVTFLFIRIEKLNKILKQNSDEESQRLVDIYKDQIRDYKDIVTKNTEAFLLNAHASEEVAESNKETKEVLINLRLWLMENLEKKRPSK